MMYLLLLKKKLNKIYFLKGGVIDRCIVIPHNGPFLYSCKIFVIQQVNENASYNTEIKKEVSHSSYNANVHCLFYITFYIEVFQNDA